MATTPSAGAIVHTPSTPLHGAAYDSYEPYSPRYHTRASSQRLLRQAQTPEPVNRSDSQAEKSQFSTPPSNRDSSNLNSALSPPQTDRRSSKRKMNNREFLPSAAIPAEELMDEFAPAAPRIANANGPSRISSSTTAFQDGMLPTPVKTPRKKHVANVQAATRTLFQDQTQDLQETAPIAKRSKKTRRYNGFSLESFSAEDGGSNAQVQIFTDSRDRVPVLDVSEDNPFVDHGPIGEGSSSKKLAGSSKRRKISGQRPKDKDVEEAIEKDEGMIYVFRGRKVYRKFESDDEEDEELDAEDLGLLQHSAGDKEATRLGRPLTRKSIKPTRLFQTEAQKRTREQEKEEEALTDIEDNDKYEQVGVNDLAIPKAGSSRGDIVPARSLVSKQHSDLDNDTSHMALKTRAKKTSPFDSWKRVKRGATNDSSKGKKRASEALDVDEHVKKTKA